MKNMSKYLKAIYGAVAAALASTATAYVQGAGHIGWQAGITIAIAFWGALGVVWGVPNAVPVISGRLSTTERLPE